MDLIKKVMENRKALGLTNDTVEIGKKKSKAEKAKDHEAGSRSMRHFIIQEKPNKKVVREHFKALVARECESSSDED